MYILNPDPYEALKSIMKVTSTSIGNEFLEIISEELKKLFNADLVFITQAVEINPTTNVKVLHATSNDFVKEFNLDDTPCQLVFEDKVIVLQEDVSLNFKKDARFGFESFLGIPLHNDSNDCFGHIAILSKQIRDFSEESIEIAKIFGHRIEAEAKRLLLEEENTKITQKLYLQSITDALTQVHNRHYIKEKADEILNLVKRDICKASLIFFDIDDFKKINDTCGHDEGDNVLRIIGKTLKEHSRKDTDFIFRTGGEEFALIILNLSDGELLKHIDRINKNINESFENTCHKITFSVGVSNFTKEAKCFEDVYKDADEKMYKAKKLGKNRVVM